MANLVEVKNKIVNYLREVKAEAKKVVWPSRRYVLAATVIILVVIIIVGILILVVDLGFAKLFERLLKLKPR